MWRSLAPRVRFGITVVAACFGCAGAPRTAADFDGHSRPRWLRPDQLASASEVPSDYDTLGTVSAHCTRVSGTRPMDGEWLSDVACSADLLRTALHVKAAEVGGVLLVDEQCSSHPDAAAGPDGPRISCRARVTAPSRTEPSGKTPSEPLAAMGPGPARSPSVVETWNTRVEFTPALRATVGKQRRLDLVPELPRQPVDHVVVGDVVAHCEAGCSLGGARDAVRLVAASIGADAVADVRCVRQRLGWLCAGRATAYEHRPAEWSGWSP
jgi:hypothetical protein